MKVSLNLAQYYSNVDLKNLPHGELVQKIGAQLGAVEEVVDWSPIYEGVLVVKVVSCVKHPDADKLSLCRIDDGGVLQDVERGDDGFVQVVCGAPNVSEGQFVAWIPPGAVVPSTRNTAEPFTLEAREIRGKISNGMIGSPKELAISDEHEGILVINQDEVNHELQPGEPLLGLFNLDDFVVTCENKMFTHRPDCFGNLGVARELAGINGLKFESPEWYLAQQAHGYEVLGTRYEVDVRNEIKDKVPRFVAVVMNNVAIAKSPIWMQSALTRVGIKPKNNVVDVTNYIMHLTGQPLHAFDFDKLLSGDKSLTFEPRMAKSGEEITLLGNKQIKLTDQDMVISANGKAVALAGVMGGAETEVDENTKTILIECANFDMYTVRRTSMRYGLFTDAVTRFNKGQSPLQNDVVLGYAMKLMNEYASAETASQVYDLASFDTSADNLNRVKVSTEFINSRLGSGLSAEDIKTLLENVEFKVSLQDQDLEITVPFWRMDIVISEDIVEEVGRLYGYAKLPVALPARSSKPTTRNATREFKKSLRKQLKQAGANEVLTYSFVHGDLLKKTGTDPEKWAYHLRNALSPDLQYYRTSLIPSLLAKVHGNIKSQAGTADNEFALYEIGKAHVKGHFEDEEQDLPKQLNRLALVTASDEKSSGLRSGSAYYQARLYVDLLTNGQAKYEALDTNEYPITSPYLIGRSAVIKLGDNQRPVGVVGEFISSAKQALKLPEYCAGFEIDTDLLRELIKPKKYEPLSTFPGTQQDITFEVDGKTSWSQLNNLLQAEMSVAKAESGYQYSVEPLDIYQAEGSDKKRLSLRINLSHPNKTMKTEEVNLILDQISKVAHETLQATRI